MVAIVYERERLIEVRVESHPAISTEQEGASDCLIGDDIYPYRKRRGRRTYMVRLNGHSGLLIYADQLLGVEAAPRSEGRRSREGFIGGVDGYHLAKGTFVDKSLGRPRIQ